MNYAVLSLRDESPSPYWTKIWHNKDLQCHVTYQTWIRGRISVYAWSCQPALLFFKDFSFSGTFTSFCTHNQPNDTVWAKDMSFCLSAISCTCLQIWERSLDISNLDGQKLDCQFEHIPIYACKESTDYNVWQPKSSSQWNT